MYAHGLYDRNAVWAGWVTHLILLTLELVFIGYFVLDIDGRLHHVPGGYAFGLALAFFTFITEPMEVVLWSYHLLEPWVYLSLHAFKAVAWSALSGVGIWVTIWSAVQPSWSKSLIYLLHGATVLSFYATFVYAAIIFSRHRKSSGYSEKLTGREEVEEGSARFAPHRYGSGRTRPVSSVYEPFYQSTGHGRPGSGIYER